MFLPFICVIVIPVRNTYFSSLSVKKNDEVLATTPDLITIVETETGEPIQSSNMKYGLRVSVLVLPAPPLMTSDAALPFVGPEAFGFDGLTYNPVGDYKEYESIAK